MSEEALRKLALSVRNWGRWGPEDEIGTLNYITPARVAEACRLATAGKVFALGVPLGRQVRHEAVVPAVDLEARVADAVRERHQRVAGERAGVATAGIGGVRPSVK